MYASVLAAFAGGGSLTMQLLSQAPTSQDPATYLVPDWADPQKALVTPVCLTATPVSGTYRMTWPSQLNTYQVTNIWGVAVSDQGQGLAFAPLPPGFSGGTLVAEFNLQQTVGP